MTLPKNASDTNQHPQRAAAIAISIAATTFVVHPLDKEDSAFTFFSLPRMDNGWLSNKRISLSPF